MSIVESTLANPGPVLMAQLDRVKSEALAALKTAGVEYEERIEALDKLEYPKPLRDFTYDLFDTYRLEHPWAADFKRFRGVAVATGEVNSPYHARFTQGATLVPRFLLMVEDAASSPIGVAAGRRAVRSMRSANEKPPWKHLPPLQGSIERAFIRPVHLGATLLPFRLLEPWLGVIPWDGKELMDGTNPHIENYPGFAEWWTAAESVWDDNEGESSLTLLERVDFRRGLSIQVPTATHRVF